MAEVMLEDPEAYAKIVGENFEFYVDKPTFILGRKAKKEHKLAEGEQFICISEQKNISRKHVIVTWNPKDKAWYLECRGKNGLYLNGKQVTPEKARKTKLTDKAQLKISDVTIYFLLPLR
mmetsp:Transcript_12547/g.14862  ORF Transcript_12547/g.14862 Transcript_12547/m.14862 type:complete len:120 (-) Transcript_12547:341-700(-)|eukprot:jgi/Bigna1/89194/estExt_fgenesh1_pg.C_450064